MNERIKELVKQAGLKQRIWNSLGKELPMWQEDPDNPGLAKFAELIVRECLDQCYNRGMNDELYAGQLKAAAYIEQHFGVEEK
jgi:hypothetical protein